MRKRIFCLFLIVCSVLLSVATLLPAQAATTDDVTFILHKRVWFDETPTQQQNTGNTSDFGGTPLPGAVFDVYDVTSIYQAAAQKADFDAKAFVADWAQKTVAEVQASGVGSPISEQTTDQQGLIQLTLPAQKDGRYAAYLFVEKSVQVPSGYQEVAEQNAPLMVILPVYDADTQQALQTIHLYPKNVMTKKDTPVKPQPKPKPKPKPHEKPKKPTGILPQTGEMKEILSGVGVVLVLIGFVIIMKQRKKFK